MVYRLKFNSPLWWEALSSVDEELFRSALGQSGFHNKHVAAEVRLHGEMNGYVGNCLNEKFQQNLFLFCTSALCHVLYVIRIVC